MGKWWRHCRRRWRTRQGLVRRLDGTERRKGETRKGTVQRILLPVRTVERRQRIASRQQLCATFVVEKGSGKGEREGDRKVKGKGKMGKGWEWGQKGKGKGKRLQSMNEWDGWDQTDEYTSVPLLSMSCGEQQPETESPDLKITSEEWQVPMKRLKSTCLKTITGNRQFVLNNNFEAIAEQDHDEKTRQDRRRVIFDCDSDASTSRGSQCTEKCEIDPNLDRAKANLCVRCPASGRPCHSHWWSTVVLQKQSHRGRGFQTTRQ